jgi:superfamily I DNA/RNA helicase
MIEITPGRLSIGTMHLAKGLEFRSVAVMSCDDEIIPSHERIENVADNADLEEVYEGERHLLYVACTCAPVGNAGQARIRVPGRSGELRSARRPPYFAVSRVTGCRGGSSSGQL